VKVSWLEDAQRRKRRVAVGTFDGVHAGHREVIKGCDTVLTFQPHPVSVLKPELAPPLIDSFAIKRDVLESLGIEELVVIPFDRDFASLSPEEFCEQILVERLSAQMVSVGNNFRFGRGAKGDWQLLRSRSEFETRVVGLVEHDGETVSSSQIRDLIANGDVEQAHKFLNRPFMLEGQVVSGDRRGKSLGVPTANIIPQPDLLCPGQGVYAAVALESCETDPARGVCAAVSVGVRPTFDAGDSVVVESYLIDYEGDLYQKTLRVAFLRRIRDEIRFDSAQELVSQMHRDIEAARGICSATVLGQ
jgi:riboflavin kinase/FMN adenylyltransferase